MFAYSIFLSLRGYFRAEDGIIIDEEYVGHEQAIRDLIISLFNRFECVSINPRSITFECVGRESKCHIIAKQTLNGFIKPDRVLGLDDYFSLLDRTERIRRRALETRIRRRTMGE
ncbi:MAG: hypothetical protein NT157_01795 [Candidatus Micrarchaeota archaeon]|nr:hypothetical protein [Candidatus Micrarchaeota archaeon]